MPAQLTKLSIEFEWHYGNINLSKEIPDQWMNRQKKLQFLKLSNCSHGKNDSKLNDCKLLVSTFRDFLMSCPNLRILTLHRHTFNINTLSYISEMTCLQHLVLDDCDLMQDEESDDEYEIGESDEEEPIPIPLLDLLKCDTLRVLELNKIDNIEADTLKQLQEKLHVIRNSA
jgi:hypothetical protein